VLGEGWTESSEEPQGEFFLLVWLETLEADPDLIAEAAAGWAGDGSVLAWGPGDASAVASRVQWDDPATDPEQFRTLLVETLDGLETFERLDSPDPAISVWAGPVDYLAIAGAEAAPSEFLFATAPTAEQAEALVAELISSVAP
jgi:hypothetical protein